MSASRSTLTIIVSTSCSRLPELQLVHTLRVLCSLHDFQPAAPIILACDALPTEVELAEAEQQDVSKWTSTWQHRDAYDAYTAALRAEQARVAAVTGRMYSWSCSRHGVTSSERCARR